jgi:ribosome silencing factor RsfS/YbeB/iojap
VPRCGAAPLAPGCKSRLACATRLDFPAGAATRGFGHGTAPGGRFRAAGRPRSKAIARVPPSDPPLTAKRPGTPAPARRRAPQPPAALAQAARAPGTPRKKAVAAGPRPSAEAASGEAAAGEAGKPRRAARKKAEPSGLDRLQAVIVTSLEDDKAEDVVALDLVGRASFADRMVIATGLADRQISAMAAHLEEKLHEAGIRRVQIEGTGGSDWVLIDAGDIVVHLFKAEARSLYGLEKMWGAELDEP